MKRSIVLYDTTLRDGTQGEEVSFSAEDKLRICQKLDDFGIHYIEGGWPGSNPKDARFFELAKSADFANTRLTAFGSTRRAQLRTEDDPNLRALLDTGVGSVAVFGKSSSFQVKECLGVSLEENLAMIEDSVRHIKQQGREVIYDAEHFFDGYKLNPHYAIETLQAAARAGADYIVFCDTNGGSLPSEIYDILTNTMVHLIKDIKPHEPVHCGIHAHNDCGLALANTLSAVQAGVVMVQGSINGYGERCGNADLIQIIANLQLKMGYRVLSQEKLLRLTEISRFVSEVANIPPNNQRPFVGKSAFAHKGGMHVNAVMKNPQSYEHIDPHMVGNHRRVLVSDLSGRSNIEYKVRELNLKLGENSLDCKKIVDIIKEKENVGYQFDAAEGSLELLIKKTCDQLTEPFTLESFRVIIEKDGPGLCTSQATIKIAVNDEHEITAAEGNGPVNALDNALRKALYKFYPGIHEMRLVDFKVRVMEGDKGTGAKVKVQIESRDPKEIWSTIGVSENIIDASWQALSDSIQYKLLKLAPSKNAKAHFDDFPAEPDRSIRQEKQTGS